MINNYNPHLIKSGMGSPDGSHLPILARGRHRELDAIMRTQPELEGISFRQIVAPANCVLNSLDSDSDNIKVKLELYGSSRELLKVLLSDLLAYTKGLPGIANAIITHHDYFGVLYPLLSQEEKEIIQSNIQEIVAKYCEFTNYDRTNIIKAMNLLEHSTIRVNIFNLSEVLDRFIVDLDGTALLMDLEDFKALWVNENIGRYIRLFSKCIEIRLPFGFKGCYGTYSVCNDTATLFRFNKISRDENMPIENINVEVDIESFVKSIEFFTPFKEYNELEEAILTAAIRHVRYNISTDMLRDIVLGRMIERAIKQRNYIDKDLYGNLLREILE